MIGGPSGSGKSTLVELLTGLNLPNSGQILIDNIDLKDCDKKKWLNGIGFVGKKNILLINQLKKTFLMVFKVLQMKCIKKLLKFLEHLIFRRK